MMEILGEDYDLVSLDYETYYGTGCSLSLQSMNTFNYLAHPDFSIHGVGIKINQADTEWVEPRHLVEYQHDVFDTSGGRPIALLAHNTCFDGYILHHFWDIHPDLYLDTLAMSRGMFPGRKHGLKQLAERLWPNDPTMRKGEELVNFRNVTTEQLYADPNLLKAMIRYGIQDVDLTHAAFLKMLPFYPEDELELIHLTTQMMCDPMFVLDKQLIQDARDGWIAERQAKIEAAGVAESTLNSNPKFEKALTSRGVDIIHKADLRTGKMKPALGKADLGFQQMRAAHTDLDHLFEGRVAAKSVTQIRRAERFLETAEITGGTMPMPLKYYSALCVPGDTEVLTQTGWERLDEWDGGVIAQVNETQTITFQHADLFEGPTFDEWHVSDARYMPCAFTPGHCVPYLQHESFKWNTLKAADAAQRGSIYIPLGGHLDETGSITPEQMRVLVMTQADGSFCTDSAQGRQLAIGVEKPRKIERARKLLTEAGITFRESVFPSRPEMMRFTIAARDYPEWLTPERKFFDSWLLDSTPEARAAFVEELPEWDGGYNGDTQRTYSTSVKENADWAVTLCHLTGNSASICVNPANNRGGYKRKENYSVSIRPRSHGMVFKRQWAVDKTPRKTYCAKTKTGFWLARANGRIFVTGNTGRYGGGELLNVQNMNRGSALRKSLCAPPGYLVAVADSSNIEARMLAWLAGQEELLDVFRSGGDVYSHFATKLYGWEVNKEDHPHERFIGKVCVLGLGYGQGHARFRENMAAGMLGGPPVLYSEQESRDVVQTYRSVNYMIPQYWQQAAQAIVDMYMGNEYNWGPLKVTRNALIMPNGMALQYPGLRPDDEGGFEYHNGTYYTRLYGPKLVENITQALSRIVLFDQMLDINRDVTQHDGRVVLNVHDEIIAIVPEATAERDFDKMLEVMKQPPAWCADLPLDAEGGIDKSYSK